MRFSHNFQRVLPIIGSVVALASTAVGANGWVQVGTTTVVALAVPSRYVLDQPGCGGDSACYTSASTSVIAPRSASANSPKFLIFLPFQPVCWDYQLFAISGSGQFATGETL